MSPSRSKFTAIAGTCALVTMLFLIGAALFGDTFHRPSRCIAHLCWGNDGELPVLFLTGPVPLPSEPVVILPGGTSSGKQAAARASELGNRHFDTLVMPTGAPFPRGASAIFQRMPFRNLLVLQDSRSRLDWKELQKKIFEQNIPVTRCNPQADGNSPREWRFSIGQAVITYRRLPDSRFSGEISHLPPDDACLLYELLPTGEFMLSKRISMPDGTQALQELYRLPKTSYSGHIELEI